MPGTQINPFDGQLTSRNFLTPAFVGAIEVRLLLSDFCAVAWRSAIAEGSPDRFARRAFFGRSTRSIWPKPFDPHRAKIYVPHLGKGYVVLFDV